MRWCYAAILYSSQRHVSQAQSVPVPVYYGLLQGGKYHLITGVQEVKISFVSHALA